MKCNGCGNPSAHRVRITKDDECCDRCAGLGNVWVPDVSFRRPYFDPNLGNPGRPGEKDGVWVESKQHKARIMREQHLRERSDRVGGAINFDKHYAAKLRGQGSGL